MLEFAIIFAVGFLVAYVLTSVVRRYGERVGLVDEPKEGRKIHKQVMPTSGGVGIAGGMVAAVLSWLWLHPGGLSELGNTTLLVGAGAFFIHVIGVVDDRHGIGAKKKFLAQLVAAYLLLHAGFRFELGHLPMVEGDAYQMALFTIPLTVVWIVAVMNAVNLIDGLDGLAAGVASIAFAILGLIYGMQGHPELIAFAVIVTAATGGFLVHNFSPASIFMGDSGSLLIGYLLAVFTLAAPMHADMNIALAIPVVVLGLPVLDTGMSILRRMVSQRSIFSPDRGHIHHQLSQRWSVRRSVLTLYGVGIWFGGAALLMSLVSALWAYVICAVTGVVALLWFQRVYARTDLSTRVPSTPAAMTAYLQWLAPHSSDAEFHAPRKPSGGDGQSDPTILTPGIPTKPSGER